MFLHNISLYSIHEALYKCEGKAGSLRNAGPLGKLGGELEPSQWVADGRCTRKPVTTGMKISQVIRKREIVGIGHR